MTAVLAACAGALLLGPVTLRAARWAMHGSWTPGRAEVAATVALTGTLAGIAVRGGAPATLWPVLLLGPAAAVVDAREGRLPNVLTGPLLAASALAALLTGPPGSGRLLLGAAVTLAAAGVAACAGSLLGWGDVKLVPSLVIALGPVALPAGVLHVVVLVGVTAAGVRLLDRRALVPYGPAMVLATLGVAAGL